MPKSSSAQLGAVAVVLGGYVNGYNVVRELWECGVEDIWLVDDCRSLASFSNKIKGFSNYSEAGETLSSVLIDLSRVYRKLVLFPTSDVHLEMLNEIYDDISDFCFIPYNRANFDISINKAAQYEACARLGVPFPCSVRLLCEADLLAVSNLKFPLLIKPAKRDDLRSSVFRSLFLSGEDDFLKHKSLIEFHLLDGVEFIVSEFVPGDDTVIYAYTAYRSPSGEIRNEWVGKKLTQYPDLFGVFSSASNESPEIIRSLGRRLVEGMDLYGIVEPEFKFDFREGSYKLMEINLRSMMWHRLGNRSGVTLQYAQWLDATDQAPVFQSQDKLRRVHLVYGKHELLNLISRPGYFKHFLNNIFRCDVTCFSVFSWRDPLPSLRDLLTYPRAVVRACLKRFEG